MLLLVFNISKINAREKVITDVSVVGCETFSANIK